jgi:hypothetical protein
MKYLDRDNGEEIELTIIEGCNFYENTSGEIYCVDRARECAWPVRPSFALKSLLLRAEMKNNDYQFKSRDIDISKGHGDNYLNKFFSCEPR